MWKTIFSLICAKVDQTWAWNTYLVVVQSYNSASFLYLPAGAKNTFEC